MSTQNKIKEIKKQLSKYNIANVFNVYIDKINNVDEYTYNLTRTINLIGKDKISNAYYDEYQVVKEDTWASISYKFYDTIELWWLVVLFNDISNPMVKPTVGDVLKIPTDIILEIIFQNMRNV